MASLCSYAAKLAGQNEAVYGASPIELADLYCRDARIRIRRNFQDIRRNNDKITTSVAKKLLSGRYEWLENEIIK